MANTVYDSAGQDLQDKPRQQTNTMTILIVGLVSVLSYWAYQARYDDQSVVKYEMQMIDHMIPAQDLHLYKQAHDQVYSAIYSIAPKSRKVRKSHKVLRMNLNKIDDAVPLMMKAVAAELYDDSDAPLDGGLANKIKSHAEFAKIKIQSIKEKYSNINISFEKGGKSHIVVGMIGYQAVNEDEIVFGISLYQEDWQEKEYVKLNQKADVWQDANIEKFAYYLLCRSLKPSLGYE
eukprot:CAMPEP_0202721164 /NCGR_PEP_ID=MMETSP1385-20130828/146678_1 /ASSEMBLY_ACC=CAM_ASM_000861 /TAXON_ID=933848 /ORGANISM="Elphidium margaritaceum" /LENGTH=233 /DNA_ID=CAMNT_0049385265 /DNA_START=12 /DNA_END=713 /DNA_ORIENTATION=+